MRTSRKSEKRILEEDEAESKLLKRVKKSAVGDDTLSDYDSATGRQSIAQAGSPAVRDSLGFAVINPNMHIDPSNFSSWRPG